MNRNEADYIAYADMLAADGVAKGVINSGEAALLARAKALRRKVIMVDDFAPEELRAGMHQNKIS